MECEHMTNYQLAKKLGCHQTTVQNWLDGSMPQKRTQKSIADVFGVTVEEMMGDKLPSPRNENKPTQEGKLTETQREAMALIMKMSDEQLKVFIATLKAAMGE